MNEVIESPLRITGSVSDAHLASLTINGLAANLAPASGDNSYLINTSLLLPRGEQTSVDVVAIDRAGNETSLVWRERTAPR